MCIRDSPSGPRVAAATFAGDYEDLLASYEEAFAAYQQAREEGVRPRPKHPAREYFGRFEELGEGGEPRAHLWMLGHLREAGLSVFKRRQKAGEVFAALFAQDLDAELLAEVFAQLSERARDIEPEDARGWCEGVAAKHPDREVQAAALCALADVVSERGRTRDPEKLAESEALLERVRSEYAGTEAATRAALAQFEQLEREFRRDMRAFMGGELEDNPGYDYYERMAGLAEAGVGGALLWQAENAYFAGHGPEEIADASLAIYGRLVDEYAGDEDLAVRVAEALPRMADEVAQEELLELARRLERRATSDDVRVQAIYAQVSLIAGGAETDEEAAPAEALLRRIQEEYPGNPLAGQAESRLFQLRYLRVGKPVADFTTEDVDGVEFKLSDYRGKVVLLDFWGFW